MGVQLELFEGGHLPVFRARAALAQGDVAGARSALAGAAGVAGAARAHERLARLEALRSEHSAAAEGPLAVHRAFDSALRSGGAPGDADALGRSGWLALYAGRMTEALAPEPTRRFRGWCALHFALAAGRYEDALEAAERAFEATVSDAAPDGSAGDARLLLETARAAFAAGRPLVGERRALAACLAARELLRTEPPPLDPSGLPALDPEAEALPELPKALGDLFVEAAGLGLAGPASAWVPALGVLEGVVSEESLRAPELARAAGFEAEGAAPAEEPAPRAFLRALLAARVARAEEGAAPGRCGEAELRARAAMKSAAPALLRRYLAGLGLYA